MSRSLDLANYFAEFLEFEPLRDELDLVSVLLLLFIAIGLNLHHALNK